MAAGAGNPSRRPSSAGDAPVTGRLAGPTVLAIAIAPTSPNSETAAFPTKGDVTKSCEAAMIQKNSGPGCSARVPLTECPSAGNDSARAIPTAVFQKAASSPLKRACQADHSRTPTATASAITTRPIAARRAARDVGASGGAGWATAAA